MRTCVLWLYIEFEIKLQTMVEYTVKPNQPNKRIIVSLLKTTFFLGMFSFSREQTQKIIALSILAIFSFSFFSFSYFSVWIYVTLFLLTTVISLYLLFMCSSNPGIDAHTLNSMLMNTLFSFLCFLPHKNSLFHFTGVKPLSFYYWFSFFLAFVVVVIVVAVSIFVSFLHKF